MPGTARLVPKTTSCPVSQCSGAQEQDLPRQTKTPEAVLGQALPGLSVAVQLGELINAAG